MFIGQPFPVIEDGSSRALGFDLTATLVLGETLLSSIAALVCLEGEDAALSLNPAARFLATPQISGAVVTQGTSFNDPEELVAGNLYALSLAATTSLGQVISPWARFSVAEGYGASVAAVSGPTAAAQVIVLPTPGPKFIVPVLSGYAGQDFPVATPGEKRLYGFDFSPALSPNEIVRGAAASLTLDIGTDAALAANGSLYFAAAPQISGAVVQQMVAWPSILPSLAGNTYVLGISIVTAFNQFIAAWSRITIGMGF